MNSKTVGDYSQLMVIAEFIKHGIPVCQPYGDNERYDIVIELPVGFKKVQIKTARIYREVVVFKTSSSESHRGNGCKSYKGEIDFFATYCPELNQCYLIPIEEATSTEMRLRITPTKNSQTKGVRWAKDFLLSEYILKNTILV